MNKQQAYNEFWSGFGLLAWEENSMPDDKVIDDLIRAGVAESKYPYIAYQVLVDDMGHPVYPTASIYDKSTSWKRIDEVANMISEHIQTMNTIKLDDGRMFITKGSPFAQHQLESEDLNIRRIILNIGVEFFTEY